MTVAFTRSSGEMPCRIVSLTVTDKSGNDQLGLGWHFRARNYDSASTAKWAYNAEELELLDLAEKVTLAGSAGTKVVKHPNLSTSWTPILGLTLSAGTYLTHKGLYDVWARVYSTSEDLPWLRLLWDVGDIVSPSENTQIQIPGKSNYYLVNLGQINLQKAPSGTHRWKGVIQGRGEVGGENASIDRLYFDCGDESSGILTASLDPSIGASAYSARDSFKQTAGNLAGKSPDLGGNWSAVPGLEGEEDFQVDATNQRISRTHLGGVLRADRFGSALETVATSVDMRYETLPSGAGAAVAMGLVSRVVAINKYLNAYIERTPTASKLVVLKREVVAEVAKTTVLTEVAVPAFQPSTWYTLLLSVSMAGRFSVWFGNRGSLKYVTSGFDSELKAGQALASGKSGVSDSCTSPGNAVTRSFDNIAVWVPKADAVFYANRSASLSTQGMYRESEDGAGSGPVANPGADLPRLPVSGPEERLVEVALKGSRGELASLPDSGSDKISAQITYRPCWSYVSGT